VTALLEVAAADEGRAVEEATTDDRTEELVMADGAGRADEVAGRTEEVVTAEDDARVDEATEEALEAEDEVVTGLAPDDLSISLLPFWTAECRAYPGRFG
jgi:hypothetical protein